MQQRRPNTAKNKITFFKGDNILKGNVNRHVYTQIPSSTIHSDQTVEITKVPLTDRWIKQNVFPPHTVKYNSVIKRSKALTQATT